MSDPRHKDPAYCIGAVLAQIEDLTHDQQRDVLTAALESVRGVAARPALAVAADTKGPRAKRARFALHPEAGPEGIFTGWTFGDTWNGWESPRLPHSEMPRLVAYLNKESEGSSSYYEWNEARERVVEIYTETGEAFDCGDPVYCAVEPYIDDDGDEICGAGLYSCQWGLCWITMDDLVPSCVESMGCLCAFHARNGDPARPCNATE
jgi:hypothetical protein